MDFIRKTILVFLTSGADSTHTCRVLSDAGHIFVPVHEKFSVLKALTAVHFDVLLTDLCITDVDSSSYFCDVRKLAPWIAIVCFVKPANESLGTKDIFLCDATVQTPLSLSRLSWIFDFKLRYFGG